MKIDFYKLKQEDIVKFNLVRASWLQKCIRRGLVEKALAIGEDYLKENQEAGLKRRLMVYATEDIGIATPQCILLMKQEKNPLNWIRILCAAEKNREVDRFLLNVRDNYKELVKVEEIKKEVNALQYLLKESDQWFHNKRNKEPLKNMEKFITRLKENSNEFQCKLYDLAFENYKLLSRKKTFGARTNLAFIVLIYFRRIIQENTSLNWDKNSKAISLNIVDDFAIDKHTPFGKKLNRDYHWWVQHGAPVTPEKTYKSQFFKDGSEKYPY